MVVMKKWVWHGIYISSSCFCTKPRFSLIWQNDLFPVNDTHTQPLILWEYSRAPVCSGGWETSSAQALSRGGELGHSVGLLGWWDYYDIQRNQMWNTYDININSMWFGTYERNMITIQTNIIEKIMEMCQIILCPYAFHMISHVCCHSFEPRTWGQVPAVQKMTSTHAQIIW